MARPNGGGDPLGTREMQAQSASGGPSNRLSEEEFVAQLVAGKEDRFLGQWKVRLKSAKARLLTMLEFDGCNAWLEDVRYFVDQAMVSSRREAAYRVVYLFESYFLIGLDYSLRTLAFELPDVRRKAIDQGFRHGSEGKAGIDRALRLATSLVDSYAPQAASLGTQLRLKVNEEFAGLPVDILAEYFGRQEINRDLFAMARSLEAQAYSRAFVPPKELESPLQGMLGVLLDYFGVDRAKFFGMP